MYNSQTAIEYVESRFPRLSQELHDETWDGLLHLQVGVFSRFAQNVIDDGDQETWQQISQLFLDLWHACTPGVENALNVSFLEHLDFSDGKKSRSWAYQVMPPAMRKAWDEMEAYNRRIHGG